MQRDRYKTKSHSTACKGMGWEPPKTCVCPTLGELEDPEHFPEVVPHRNHHQMSFLERGTTEQRHRDGRRPTACMRSHSSRCWSPACKFRAGALATVMLWSPLDTREALTHPQATDGCWQGAVMAVAGNPGGRKSESFRQEIIRVWIMTVGVYMEWENYSKNCFKGIITACGNGWMEVSDEGEELWRAPDLGWGMLWDESWNTKGDKECIND